MAAMGDVWRTGWKKQMEKTIGKAVDLLKMLRENIRDTNQSKVVIGISFSPGHRFIDVLDSAAIPSPKKTSQNPWVSETQLARPWCRDCPESSHQHLGPSPAVARVAPVPALMAIGVDKIICRYSVYLYIYM